MSNDALFEEIEQFLADGGEPPDPTPQEQMAVAFEQFSRGIEEFAAAVAEVFGPIFDAIVAWAKNVSALIVQFIIETRREQLRHRLVAWRIPRFVATWLADRWPERWLPRLA